MSFAQPAMKLTEEAISPSMPLDQRSLQTLIDLRARAEEVGASAARTQQALADWRKEHEGFTSISRLVRQAGQSNPASPHGANTLGRRRIWDPETFAPAPQRTILSALALRQKALRETEIDVALGATIRAPKGLDPAIDEAWSEREHSRISEKSGPPPEVEKVKRRLAYLARAIRERNAVEASDFYIAAVRPLFGARTAEGEGLQVAPNGQTTLTGLINRMLLSGRAEGLAQRTSRLVLSADELRRMRADLVRWARRGNKGAKDLPPELRNLKRALRNNVLIDQEIARLARLSRNAAFATLYAAGLDRANSAMRRLKHLTPGELTKAFGSGLLEILDSPETYAMVLMGFGLLRTTPAILKLLGIEGLPTSHLALYQSRTAATTSAAATSAATAIAPARLGHRLAARAVDAVTFQLGLNLFNHARRKHERADWSATGFLRSLVLFQTLGGLHGWQARWTPPKTTAGKVVRAASTLGTEALALSGLAVGEARLRSSEELRVEAALLQNFQFLLAMRIVQHAPSVVARSWSHRGFDHGIVLRSALIESDRSPAAIAPEHDKRTAAESVRCVRTLNALAASDDVRDRALPLAKDFVTELAAQVQGNLMRPELALDLAERIQRREGADYGNLINLMSFLRKEAPPETALHDLLSGDRALLRDLGLLSYVEAMADLYKDPTSYAPDAELPGPVTVNGRSMHNVSAFIDMLKDIKDERARASSISSSTSTSTSTSISMSTSTSGSTSIQRLIDIPMFRMLALHDSVGLSAAIRRLEELCPALMKTHGEDIVQAIIESRHAQSSAFVTNVLGSVAVEPSIGSRWRTAIERARNTKSLQTFNDWLGSEAGFLSHESLGRYFGPESKNIDDTLRRLIEHKAALFDELAARGAPISQFILDWVANFYEERSLQKWLRIASSQVAATPKSGFPAEAEIRSTIENLARAVQGYWEIDGAVLQAMKRLTPPQKKLLESDPSATPG